MLGILFVGHSHIEALRRAWDAVHNNEENKKTKMSFLNIRHDEYRISDKQGNKISPLSPENSKYKKILSDFCAMSSGCRAVVFLLSSNEHNSIGTFVASEDSDAQIAELIKDTVLGRQRKWFELFAPCSSEMQVYVLMAPPPVESEFLIRDYAARRAKEYAIRPPDVRLSFWRNQCDQVRLVAREYGFNVIEIPDTVVSDSGLLAEQFVGIGATHGNIEYGVVLLSHILNHINNHQGLSRALIDINVKGAKELLNNTVSYVNPYSSLPSYAYWHQSVSQVAGDALDPVVSPRFIIKRKHKVATAGSCFAQHISKRLKTSGFNYFVAEKPDTDSSAEVYDFSARYGNVYTARQLVQLFDRAFGYFNPIDKVWPHTKSGAYCDPFRPRIEPNGFADEQAVLLDRKKHLSSVRRMFKQLDVFVFTLGLTECWLSRLDGAAYPVAPGVVGGVFDSTKYEFVNFGVQDVVTDLNLFIHKLKLVNPKAKIILTVSPVPLVATQEQQHVLVATTYSKSVLRVAADEVARIHDHVQYFPSYEIITGPHASGRYFASDLRSVTEDGVDHVMRVFMSRMTEQSLSDIERPVVQESEKQFAEMEALAEAACDEEVYRQGN